MAQDSTIGRWDNSLLREQIERDRRVRQYNLPPPDARELADRLQSGGAVSLGDGNQGFVQHNPSDNSVRVTVENMETQERLEQHIPEGAMGGMQPHEMRLFIARLMMELLRRLAEQRRQRREQQGSNGPGMAPPPPAPKPERTTGNWREQLERDLTDIFVRHGGANAR